MYAKYNGQITLTGEGFSCKDKHNTLLIISKTRSSKQVFTEK